MHLASTPGTEPNAPDARLTHAVDLAVSVDPDVVLLSGDIADDGSPVAYRRTRQLLGRLPAPILATPGNHDARQPLADVFGTSDTLLIGGWRILTADTLIAGELHGQIDVAALAERLGADEGTPTLLALHHPPITTSTHPWFQLIGAAELIAMLGQRGDVRLVTSGHLHQAFNVVCAGVSFIGCSSTWYSLAHHDAEYIRDGGHVGILVMDLSEDGAFTWHRLPSPSSQWSVTRHPVGA